MASVDRYRPPPREGYQPPSLPANPNAANRADRTSKSPSKRRDIPPAVPSPPSHTSRTSPPRPHSRRSAPSPQQSPPRTPARQQPNQWHFTSEEVQSSPSIIDGLSPAEERLRRAKGVNFIIQVGILLDLPQITLWVASVFFHRFYMRMSLVEEKGGIHHYNIAATAVFLANKTEENCRKTKELIIAVAKVAQKNKNLVIDEQSKEYWRWRDSILMYEELMLELLTFDLMVDNPYQRLFDQLGQLGLVHNRPLREAAWAYCNDACLTVLPLLLESRDISIAAIFFATSVTHEKIDDINGDPWWRVLSGNEVRCVKALDTMLEFYAENPLRKSDSRYQGSPEFSLESTRRRGEMMLSQTEAGSSNNGTPMGTDGGMQSPRGQSDRHADGDNGGADTDKSHSRKESDGGGLAEADSRVGGGDSDVVLKAAANNMDVYVGKSNGARVRSPLKRKSVEMGGDEEGTGRGEKRPRRNDEEEGEVPEH